MRILLLSAAEETVRLCTHAVRGDEVELVVARDIDEPAAAAGITGVDAILLDVELIEAHGPGEIARVQLAAAGRPILALTRTADEETARRALKAGAGDSEHGLRLFIQQLPTVLWTTDTELRLESVLGAGLERLGQSAEQLIGRTLFELQGAEVRHSLRALAGESVTADVPFGSHWLSVHVDPLRDAAGAIVGTIGIGIDITKSRRSEERQRRLTEVIEASPDYVATFDASHRALYVNGAGRDMLGLTQRADVAGEPLSRFHPPAAARALIDWALPHAERDGTWNGESELKGVEGRTLPVWATIVAHRDEAGAVTFYSVVARDVTERRRLEEQFRESQKMEAIGRLAGGVAHDFNNLLTTITGHGEMLREQLSGELAAAGDVDVILRAAERAAGLTRKLLAFSRRQLLQPTFLSLNAVAQGVIELVERMVGPDVTVLLEPHPELPAVRADRGQLEQVIVHLCNNARDAMPDGGIITLRTDTREVRGGNGIHESTLPPGPYVELAVSDTGHGMEPSVMSRIFEPFFTTREDGRATGLGLPTVYGIVTQSGGAIQVESEAGAGSTFRVLLPAAPQPAELAPRERPAGGSETILLVEDEPAVRRLNERVLQRRGYSVIAAGSAAEAQAWFEQSGEGVVLLVTDIVMPDVSGTELAERLRQIQPSLRVLFTSGYTADALSRDAPLPPRTAFLEKPFTPDALAASVRQLLDGESSTGT